MACGNPEFCRGRQGHFFCEYNYFFPLLAFIAVALASFSGEARILGVIGTCRDSNFG